MSIKVDGQHILFVIFAKSLIRCKKFYSDRAVSYNAAVNRAGIRDMAFEKRAARIAQYLGSHPE